MEQRQQLQLSEVEKNVAVLQTEVRNYGQIMARLDDAITSMSKVSNNLERLLVVHEERIKNQATSLEIHRKEVGVMSIDLNNRMDGMDTTLQTRIQKLEEKVDDINKWRWTVIGAWAVISFLIGRAIFGG